MKTTQKSPATLLIVIAFALVYVVWGSTYFFIKLAIDGFPPMLMGAIRFLIAGGLMLAWCWYKGDKLWVKRDVITSAISGLLMLFVAMGSVIWAEQTLPSAMVAIMTATNPIWMVVLDRANWKVNLKSKATIGGLALGLAGVFFLFGEAIMKSFAGTLTTAQLVGFVLMLVGPAMWCLGGLYSKKQSSTAPARLNTAWQMLIAGIAFVPASLIHGEYRDFQITQVPAQAWLALGYLIVFGSIVAFTAYVWLLQVRPATQVSTHSYVNPVIAVLLGVLFANEHISAFQLIGLVVILVSVLLVNLSKYNFSFKKSGKTVLRFES